MTRDEHLQWCKDRALEYVDIGELQNAFASMVSDLSKHEKTVGHSGIGLGMLMLVAGLLGTRSEMRDWIEGFN